MDLICPRCGEPWDFDTLHTEAELRYEREYGVSHTTTHRRDPALATARYQPIYAKVATEFRSRGCVALVNFRGTEEPCFPDSQESDDRGARAMAAYHLCGDDMDGAAAMLEDFEAME